MRLFLRFFFEITSFFSLTYYQIAFGLPLPAGRIPDAVLGPRALPPWALFHYNTKMHRIESLLIENIEISENICQKEKAPGHIPDASLPNYGGVAEIRTPASLATPNDLANRPLQPA